MCVRWMISLHMIIMIIFMIVIYITFSDVRGSFAVGVEALIGIETDETLINCSQGERAAPWLTAVFF